jgi:L-aspartate oxidase
VFAACKSAGIDPRVDMIPVAPAAHYHMGGIVPDFWGRSSLDGLSVCGECTSTGVHGANRLASNSLLEAVVFAHRIASRLRRADLDQPGTSRGSVPGALPFAALQQLRRAMSEKCGVVRTGPGMREVLDLISGLKDAHGPARALITAELIVRSALNREESRGGHFRSDHPDTADPRRQFLMKDFKEAVCL